MIRTLLLVLVLGGTARAFPTGIQFDADPLTMDGAGGIAFNGAPRWTGHDCSVCHTDPPHLIGLELDSDHPEVFTTGWKPAQQYHMRVTMQNEHAAAQYAALGDNCGANGDQPTFTPCDDNGFSLEMDDANGNPTGKFVPVVSGACANSGTIPNDVDIRVLTDGSAVTHTGAHAGMTTWDLCWTAPSAGAGVITAYLAAVDGNGGDGTANFPQDTLGDDVAVGQVPMLEAGVAPPPAQTGGCAATGELGGGAIILVIAALARRRRGLLVLLVAGCVHVRASQREVLAHRNMKFGPDPTEDELDLHMQEAREGASGGYGSSGGGCGCN